MPGTWEKYVRMKPHELFLAEKPALLIKHDREWAVWVAKLLEGLWDAGAGLPLEVEDPDEPGVFHVMLDRGARIHTRFAVKADRMSFLLPNHMSVLLEGPRQRIQDTMEDGNKWAFMTFPVGKQFEYRSKTVLSRRQLFAAWAWEDMAVFTSTILNVKVTDRGKEVGVVRMQDTMPVESLPPNVRESLQTGEQIRLGAVA
jgi:hypothetical protein